jgi:3-oxoacyl-(acyl-carrier-protein) synthase
LHAAETALARAEITPDSIGLIVWAPQGNVQDKKVLDVLRILFGERTTRLPLITTTLNTGYIESASILVSVAAVLEALRSGSGFWPQLTGIKEIDAVDCSEKPGYILVLASTDIGYNFSAVLRNGCMV